MALIKVRPTRTVEAFISEEPIGGLAVVCVSTGGRSVKEGTSTTQELVAGVAPAAVASGVRCPVITHGIVSGVICGAVVSAGDRVTCINITSGPGLASGAGKITPINTIIPVGAISRVSGLISQVSGLISQVSGLISPVAGTISRVSGLISPVAGTISQVSGFINLVSGIGAGGGVGVDGTSLSNISGAPISGLAGFVGATPAFAGDAPVFSGAVPTFAGDAPVFSGAVPTFAGAAPVFSGAVPTFTGTAFNTARVVGKALDHGGIGSGIRLLVDIGA